MICRNILKLKILSTGFLILFLFSSCDLSNKFREYEEKERIAIQNFLAQNDSLDFVLKTSGLYYYDVVIGTGPQAETHDTAYVFYSMVTLEGHLIDSNVGTNDTLIFPVNEGRIGVKGFDEGVTYMKEGGRALFLVPSSLAYGAYGTYYVPSYTPLIFDTELVKLVKHSGKK